MKNKYFSCCFFPLFLLRKKQSRHAERKKSDILEMVREEVLEDLEEMARVDQQIRRVFVSPDAKKVALYLRPLTSEKEEEEEKKAEQEETVKKNTSSQYLIHTA